MAKPFFKPVEVNIVEESGWNRWDPAGNLSLWASDNAWDDWSQMSEEDCAEHVGDLADASMRKRERKKVQPEDLKRICRALKEDGGELESVRNAIMDALTWAWEEAYTPDDGDIEEALTEASDGWREEVELREHWAPILRPVTEREGPKEWTPPGKFSEGQIAAGLAEKISYKRQPGYYDRFLVFDFGASWPVSELLKRERPGAEDALSADFEGWREGFLSDFFRALDRVMERAEPWQKMEFRKHWKSVLGDKAAMKAVRSELLEFLSKPVAEEE